MAKLRHIKHLALDLDGTLYLGGKLFDCTLLFLDRLRRLGIGRTFFTNNSSRSTTEYLEKLRKLGIETEPNDFYSSTHATIDYLRDAHADVKRVYILGTPALRDEFTEHGFEQSDTDPQAVIVGYDTTLSYDRLCRAAYWISQNKLFLATNPDRVCPTDQPTVLPDCGAICRMLTHATHRQPDAVLGKPNPRMLQGVMKRHNVKASHLAVVGDRLYTDVAMAHAVGATGILVLSGETTREQSAEARPAPDLIVENVGELADLLSACHQGATCRP